MSTIIIVCTLLIISLLAVGLGLAYRFTKKRIEYYQCLVESLEKELYEYKTREYKQELEKREAVEKYDNVLLFNRR